MSETTESQQPFMPVPLQAAIIEATQAFIASPLGRQMTGAHGTVDTYDKDILQFRLPRGSGSTTLCYHLCNTLKCPLIVKDYDSVKSFGVHQKVWGGGLGSMSIVTPADLERFCSFATGDVSAIGIKEHFIRSYEHSKVIIFDVFRAYDNNKMVKKLIKDLAGQCKFVMFQ